MYNNLWGVGVTIIIHDLTDQNTRNAQHEEIVSCLFRCKFQEDLWLTEMYSMTIVI